MSKANVLFVCVHNGARSQMAEAYLNAIAGDRFYAQSAGLEPGELNPYAVKAMAEVGLDISNNATKALFDFVKKGTLFDFVITVCDGSEAYNCPVFIGHAKKLFWSFPDPSALQGTEEEKLQGTRAIRDAIKTQLEDWIKPIA